MVKWGIVILSVIVVDAQTGKPSKVKAGDVYGTLSNEVCLPKVEVKSVC